MTYNLLHRIQDVVTISIDSFDKAIKSGMIIYYDSNSILRLIRGNDFAQKCTKIESGSSYYEVHSDSMLFKFNDTIKELHLDTCSFDIVCSTREENINIIDEHNFHGITSRRNPRTLSQEIISRKKGVVYKWKDDKALLHWEPNLKLFQTRLKGDLFALNTETDEIIWKIEIDQGIPGKRFMCFSDSNFLFVQKYFDAETSNLLKLDSKTGEIIWETVDTYKYYSFDPLKSKLFGLNGNQFEVINSKTGNKELQTVLDADLQISSHLTYYNEGYLYFSGHFNKNIPVFGAIDVNTGKLEFIHEVDVEGEKSFRKGLHKPYVVDNRLYVKDTMNTLHIFERE